MSDTVELPAWFNIDAFDLPADHIATVNKVSDELLAIVKRLGPLLERASVADRALEKATEGPNSDDVMELLFAYTGRGRLWNLLGIMQRLGEEVTGGSGLMDPHFAECCERYGIEVTFDDP